MLYYIALLSVCYSSFVTSILFFQSLHSVFSCLVVVYLLTEHCWYLAVVHHQSYDEVLYSTWTAVHTCSPL